MRIVGGALRGRAIHAPKGIIARPTTDRIRESIFNILAHRDDTSIEGARVIDLFAGSGALGLEALSRGATFSLFVEENPAARAAIRDNIEALSLFGQTKIHRRSATALGTLPAPLGGPFTIAFLDPPYHKDLLGPALESLVSGGWLSPHAVIICELAKNDPMPDHEMVEHVDERIYGNTRIVFQVFRAP